MNEEYFILSLAKQRIEKEIVKADKQVEKASQKLHSVDFEQTSVRQRANMRINLNVSCEERDRWIRRLNKVEEWRSEVRHDKTGDSGSSGPGGEDDAAVEIC